MNQQSPRRTPSRHGSGAPKAMPRAVWAVPLAVAVLAGGGYLATDHGADPATASTPIPATATTTAHAPSPTTRSTAHSPTPSATATATVKPVAKAPAKAVAKPAATASEPAVTTSGSVEQRRAETLRLALSQVGVLEGPAADKYFATTSMPRASSKQVPWCGAFVSWAVNKTRLTRFDHLAVAGWLDAARAGRGQLTVVKSPQPGDLALYDWTGRGVYNQPASHMGIVAKVLSPTSFQAVEGNTHKKGGPDGVLLQQRSTTAGYAVVFVRVG